MRWRQGLLIIVAGVVAVLTTSFGTTRSAADKAAPGGGKEDPNPAVNDPDQFAWRLFADINKPAQNGRNDTVWETWATDDDTFPPNPEPKDPTKRPKWPGGKAQPLALKPSTQLHIFFEQQQKEPTTSHPFPLIGPQGAQEEVRRNKVTFDYIVNNDLWYLNGLAAAASAGKPINVPPDSIEIKAHWKPIQVKDKPRYHWNTDASGKLFGLIALHVSSKALPNWHWATFEQVDNPQRGKVLGCHDSFGVTPPNTCDGKVSDALLDLLKKAGLGEEWQNYRLDGSQVNFIDSTGRPTLLGNSEVEGPFLTTSSCITCHAKAAVNGNGVFLPVFKQNQPVEGNVGAPDPSWYFNSGGTSKFLQADFIWGFSQASPAKQTAPSP